MKSLLPLFRAPVGLFQAHNSDIGDLLVSLHADGDVRAAGETVDRFIVGIIIVTVIDWAKLTEKMTR